MKTTTKQHQFAGTRREWVVATAVALLAWVTPAPAQNPYAMTRGADMPIPTADATCSPVVNGNIYLFGGRTPGYQSLTDRILVYNVASDTWRVAAGRMPYAYCGGGSNYTAAWGGKVYVSPGLGPTDNNGWGQHNRIIEFDPATERAVERAAFPAATIWRLNLVTTGSSIYCFGASGLGEEHKIWRYDPSTNIMAVVGTTVALMDCTAISGPNRWVYLFSWRGGLIEAYDPESNTCQQTASFWDTRWGGPMPWRGPGNQIYLLCPPASSLRGYNPMTDVLTDLGVTYPFAPVWSGMCHMWDDTTGRVYFFGGYSFPPYQTLAGTYILVPPQDTAPPTINGIFANPSELWPPDKKMVRVTVAVDAEDNSGQVPTSKIVGVTSNEPINRPGVGQKDPDWQYTNSPLVILLKADRSGSGSGRVYTIHVSCEDASGNGATATVKVTVPHDQGK